MRSINFKGPATGAVLALVCAFALWSLPAASARAADAALSVAPCFDYYHFGSVQVDVAALSRTASAGTPIAFSGSIKNDNSYPIVDGAVYVKVVKGTSDVVDQFFAIRDISIPANRQMPVQFSWKVPAYAQSGDYHIATFFVAADKFNLSGLTFTDDIVGTTAGFTVVGDQKSGISFDRSAASLNAQPYAFSSFSPQFSATEPIVASAQLKNTGAAAKTVVVTYTLYSWDALSPDQIIDSRKESVSIPANGSKAVSYTVADTSHGVYYLVIKADNGDSSSIVDIRFARQGIDHPRINFVSPAQYPLMPGTANPIFVCVHNAGTASSIADQRVDLSVTDGSGATISKASYSGPISGAVMGLVDSITPQSVIGDFTVTAQVFDHGTFVEQASMKYVCSDLSPGSCTSTGAAGISSPFALGFVFLVAILAILVLIIILKHRKDHGVGSHLLVVILAIVAIALILIFGFSFAAADLPLAHGQVTSPVSSFPTLTPPENVVQWTNGSIKPAAFSSTPNIPKTSNDPVRFTVNAFNSASNMALTVLYGAGMSKAGTSPQHLSNNDTVNVGDKIIITPAPFLSQDIAWFLTGNLNDTPYGMLAKPSFNSDMLAPDCGGTNFSTGGTYGTIARYTGGATNNGTGGIYDMDALCSLVTIGTPSPASVQPQSSNLTSNSDGSYTVTAAGPVSFNVVFPSTTATQYSESTYRSTNNNGPCNDANISGQMGCIVVHEFHPSSNSVTIPVPQQTIHLSLTAIAPSANNNAPTTPSLTLSSTSVCTAAPLSFSAAATDPDNDAIYYEFVFDNDLTAPQRAPVSGTVPSGTSETGTKSWASIGSHTIKVHAIDINGAASAYSPSQSVAVTDCEPPPGNPPTNPGGGGGNPGNPPDNGTVVPPTNPPNYPTDLDLIIGPNAKALNAVTSTAQAARYKVLYAIIGQSYALRWVNQISAAGYSCSLSASRSDLMPSSYDADASETIGSLSTANIPAGNYTYSLACTMKDQPTRTSSVQLNVANSNIKEI